MNIPKEAINSIASSLDVNDIVDFIDQNRKEFEGFLSSLNDNKKVNSNKTKRNA